MSGHLARRLAVTALGLVCLGVVGAAPVHSVRVQSTPTAAGPWLDRFNSWRANVGLPALSENSSWSAGDYDHALYMVKNDLVTHYETPGTPYYNSAGDTAARHSNIYVSSTTATTDTQAIDWWMAAPFHALGMMDPRLTSTGFGSYREAKSGWDMGAALDVLSGNSFTGGSYPVYFPGNNTTEPLTTYGGNEFPDPLQACPGYAAPTGLPVFVQVGGNVATTAGSVHSFTGNGVPLAHCVLDSNSPSVGSNLTSRGAVIVIPRQPLQAGVQYVVSVTVNGVPYTWTFSVGAFNSCTSVTASASPTALAAPGATVTVSAAATGCTSPQYEFWLQSPAGTWTMKQAFSAASTWSWNTTGYAPGLYTIHVWANQQGTSTVTYQTLAEVRFPLAVPAPCATAAVSPAPVTAVVGSTINFTASSTVCPSPRYEYWIRFGTSWYIWRPFSSDPSWSLSTAGFSPGTYLVHAWANQAGDQTAALEAVGESVVTLTGCTSATLQPAQGTVAAGTSVTFTAGSSGCPNPQYEFWIQDTQGYWHQMTGFGGPSWTWVNTGWGKGTYHIHVWANQQGAYTGRLETVGSSTYVLT